MLCNYASFILSRISPDQIYKGTARQLTSPQDENRCHFCDLILDLVTILLYPDTHGVAYDCAKLGRVVQVHGRKSGPCGDPRYPDFRKVKIHLRLHLG